MVLMRVCTWVAGVLQCIKRNILLAGGARGFQDMALDWIGREERKKVGKRGSHPGVGCG